MARTLCPDRQRAVIAAASAVLLVLHGSGLTQIAAMVIGGTAGWLWCRDVRAPTFNLATPIPGAVAAWGLALFALLLIALPAAAWLSPRGPVAFVGIFYRAGALVFGGGHVVLPLLREALVPTGWTSDDAFLAGYGLAQAMPGPLFTFAAYLGAASAPAHAAALSAAIALVAMFLPGLLLAASGRSLLSQFKPSASAYAILAGVNASVVGILGAALYSPVWTSAVRSLSDGIVALIAFALLQGWRIPSIAVVLLCVCVCVSAAL